MTDFQAMAAGLRGLAGRAVKARDAEDETITWAWMDGWRSGLEMAAYLLEDETARRILAGEEKSRIVLSEGCQHIETRRLECSEHGRGCPVVVCVECGESVERVDDGE